MTAPTAMLGAALSCAERGWRVFPVHSVRGGRCTCRNNACTKPGKHPRTEHGMLEATRDAAPILLWWRRWPDANLGAATGEGSGLLVLDVDVRHGGERAVIALQRRIALFPATLTSQTGGGGWHLFFRHPGGRIPCSAGRIGSGLDVRADGGSVILAPSIHASGKHYEWLDASAPVADAPTWFTALVRPVVRAVTVPASAAVITSMSAYGRAALDGEAAVVRSTREGARNEQLNRSAFRLGQLVHQGALDREVVATVLLAAALDAGLIEADAMPTIRSGLRAGLSKPRFAMALGRRA